MIQRRFDIALSFPGEYREFVAEVAEILRRHFGDGRVLYDHYFKAEFARADLGFYLPNLYREESDLVVVFLCPEYMQKEWCGVEWLAIYDLIKKRQHDSLMLFRFDNTRIDGIYSIAGFCELEGRDAGEAARLIIERFNFNHGKPTSSTRSANGDDLHVPQCLNEFDRELSLHARQLRQQRRELHQIKAAPEQIAALDRELREVKRKLRDGPQLKPGDCLANRYTLLNRVGQGGFAAVWRCLDEEDGQVVAVKVLHGQFSDSSERRDRFRRGASAMRRLSHANVVRLMSDPQDDGGFHFFVMEFLDGGNFREFVLQQVSSLYARLELIIQVANGLACGHERGIIHRDVTPDNILLTRDFRLAKLTDFDLVRLPDSMAGTRTGALGHFGYAAPETLEKGYDVDQRADVYSLGKTTVFAVYGSDLPHNAMYRSSEFIAALPCHPAMRQFLMSAVAEDRDARPASTAEFAQRLKALMAESDADQTVSSVTQSTVQNSASTIPELDISKLLDQFPNAVLLTDAEQQVVWWNSRAVDVLSLQTAKHNGPKQMKFFDLIKPVEIIGGEAAPFEAAAASGNPAECKVRLDGDRFLSCTVVAIAGETRLQFLVSVTDISSEQSRAMRLAAISQMGFELTDITPDEIREMDVDDRIELLKSKIMHFTQEILGYDAFEIRLLDSNTAELMPLLSVGFGAVGPQLHADNTGNGIQGFVAATGRSYLCTDTVQDPLYVTGSADARSALCVPIIVQDNVIGVFQIEEQSTDAFDEQDLEFLERFVREIGTALLALDLLASQDAVSRESQSQSLLAGLAAPVDRIIANTSVVLETLIGHDSAISCRLQEILQDTRNIRATVGSLGTDPEKDAGPAEKVRRNLKNIRLLVVDADEQLRLDVHRLLDRHGCLCETASNASEAITMARVSSYNAVIFDIHTREMPGEELFSTLQEIAPSSRLIASIGFGYDPGHSVVKARQKGLKYMLYKPFRADQLLDFLEDLDG